MRPFCESHIKTVVSYVKPNRIMCVLARNPMFTIYTYVSAHNIFIILTRSRLAQTKNTRSSFYD